MKVDHGIWGKLTRVVIFLLLISGLLVVAVWYLPLIRQNERYRKELLRLEEELRKEQDTSKQLRASIEALRRDPKAVERLVRERLGYGRPDEIIVRFEEPVTNR